MKGCDVCNLNDSKKCTHVRAHLCVCVQSNQMAKCELVSYMKIMPCSLLLFLNLEVSKNKALKIKGENLNSFNFLQ